MYKLLLCIRYLRTRWLAMVCIVSVMLGVATLIVVNSVMSGFSTKLRSRLHSLIANVIIEARDFEGFHDPKGKIAQIFSDPELKSRIEAMTPTLEIFAMLQYRLGMEQAPYLRPVRLIGIEPEGRKAVGGFAEFLMRPENREKPSFDLDADAARRYSFQEQVDKWGNGPDPEFDKPRPGEPPAPDRPSAKPAPPQGIILGYAIAHYPDREAPPDKPRDVKMLLEGDSVVLMTLSGARMAPVDTRVAISDYSRTEMSEYDSNYVYMSLDYMQRWRAMGDRVTSILVRLKNYDDDATFVVDRLRKMYPGLEVQTWEDKQGPLLSAIRIEKGILNVLLFMIIAVAGFGILAIFSMIVVEKTRDIGILKSLGASNMGILKIFLGYGLLLGVVGAGVGTIIGLTFTLHINEIEHLLSRLTGQSVFPSTIYYFKEIPTDIQPMTLLFVNLGAVGIAVLFSVLPALRAATLHPVRALRFE